MSTYSSHGRPIEDAQSTPHTCEATQVARVDVASSPIEEDVRLWLAVGGEQADAEATAYMRPDIARHLAARLVEAADEVDRAARARAERTLEEQLEAFGRALREGMVARDGARDALARGLGIIP